MSDCVLKQLQFLDCVFFTIIDALIEVTYAIKSLDESFRVRS